MNMTQAAVPDAVQPSAQLARFVAESTWDDIPQPVRHAARRALLNFFAVALSAARTPSMDIALRTYARFSAVGTPAWQDAPIASTR